MTEKYKSCYITEIKHDTTILHLHKCSAKFESPTLLELYLDDCCEVVFNLQKLTYVCITNMNMLVNLIHSYDLLAISLTNCAIDTITMCNSLNAIYINDCIIGDINIQVLNFYATNCNIGTIKGIIHTITINNCTIDTIELNELHKITINNCIIKNIKTSVLHVIVIKTSNVIPLSKSNVEKLYVVDCTQRYDSLYKLKTLAVHNSAIVALENLLNVVEVVVYDCRCVTLSNLQNLTKFMVDKVKTLTLTNLCKLKFILFKNLTYLSIDNVPIKNIRITMCNTIILKNLLILKQLTVVKACSKLLLGRLPRLLNIQIKQCSIHCLYRLIEFNLHNQCTLHISCEMFGTLLNNKTIHKQIIHPLQKREHTDLCKLFITHIPHYKYMHIKNDQSLRILNNIYNRRDIVFRIPKDIFITFNNLMLILLSNYDKKIVNLISSLVVTRKVTLRCIE